MDTLEERNQPLLSQNNHFWCRKQFQEPFIVLSPISGLRLGAARQPQSQLNDVANGRLPAARHEAGRSVYFDAFTPLIRL
jgi:hypothetical protein